jgi:selenocysteine lyase/cysteine desulfurase
MTPQSAAPAAPSSTLDVASIRKRIVGSGVIVPTLDGRTRPYINLDNAASTPALASAVEAVNNFLPWYSSIHRGAGYKSQLSTAVYESARETVCRFVGAEPGYHSVVFGKNTTEAINALAFRIGCDPDAVVLSTVIEHHSNLLPWRLRTQLEYVNVDREGHIDLAHLEEQLRRYGKRVKLVAVCGGSNVTGCVPPIHEIARLAHRAGARILVDAAQLAPHRAIHMGRPGGEDALDFVVFSAHKIYAPFGIGVLVGPTRFFEDGPPAYVGGGTVDIVMEDEIIWSEAPHREEAGSPNVVGAVALAAALREIMAIGMPAIESHERELTMYALDRLATVPGVQLFGAARCDTEDRLGVLTFNIAGQPHARVAAILTYEHAVAVRNGCFCAHPYLLHLLDMSLNEAKVCREQIRRRNYSAIPGAVRMSFGIYNTREDIDAGIDGLMTVAEGRERGRYHIDPPSGQYHPEGYMFDFTEQPWAKALLS